MKKKTNRTDMYEEVADLEVFCVLIMALAILGTIIASFFVKIETIVLWVVIPYTILNIVATVKMRKEDTKAAITAFVQFEIAFFVVSVIIFLIQKL